MTILGILSVSSSLYHKSILILIKSIFLFLNTDNDVPDAKPVSETDAFPFGKSKAQR